MDKKKKKSYKQSKLNVLKDMSKEMKSMMSPREMSMKEKMSSHDYDMGDSMKYDDEMMYDGKKKPMKKVIVSANKDQDLMDGLSKAKDLLKKMKKKKY